MTIFNVGNLVCHHHHQGIFIGDVFQQAAKEKHMSTKGGKGIHCFIINVMHADIHLIRQTLRHHHTLSQRLQIAGNRSIIRRNLIIFHLRSKQIRHFLFGAKRHKRRQQMGGKTE